MSKVTTKIPSSAITAQVSVGEIKEVVGEINELIKTKNISVHKSDIEDLGVNNPKYNKKLNNEITNKPELIHNQKINERVSELAHQFNTTSIEPKAMKLNINGKSYSANPNTSIRVPIFQQVSDHDVITYFKELSGVDKLPMPKSIPKMKDLDGNTGKVWTVKPETGPLRGSTINLRNFSTSQKDTNSKYTIEIIQSKDNKSWESGIRSRKIEIKFEK